MNPSKNIWLDSIYTAGRDFGHQVVSEQPNIEFLELEIKIFNHLMEIDGFRKYHLIVEQKSKQAAQRAWQSNAREIKNNS